MVDHPSRELRLGGTVTGFGRPRSGSLPGPVLVGGKTHFTHGGTSDERSAGYRVRMEDHLNTPPTVSPGRADRFGWEGKVPD